MGAAGAGRARRLAGPPRAGTRSCSPPPSPSRSTRAPPADPGWQLSFAAVAGILALAPPIRRGAAAACRACSPTAIAVTRRRHGRHGAAARASLRLRAAGGRSRRTCSALPARRARDVARDGRDRARPAGRSAGRSPAAGARYRGRRLSLARAARAISSALAEVRRRSRSRRSALPARSAAARGRCLRAARGGGPGARRRARRAAPRAQAAAARWRRAAAPHARSRCCRALAALVVLAVGAGRRRRAPPDRLTVSFLDVGQGDATLIQDRGGAAVLFDGGPPEARGRAAAAPRRRAPARRRRRDPPLARPPRRPARGARRLPGRAAARRRRRHPRPGLPARRGRAARRRGRAGCATSPRSSSAPGGLRIRVLSPGRRAARPAARGPEPARGAWRSSARAASTCSCRPTPESPALLALDAAPTSTR